MKVARFVAVWVIAFQLFNFAKAALVGGEFTFSRADLIEAGQNIPTDGILPHNALLDATILQWLTVIQQKCSICIVKGNVVHVGDHFWFELHRDPWVIEVTMKPMDGEVLSKEPLKSLIQETIWGSARSIGLVPQDRIGGGHVHLDIGTHFENDPLLFRNFVVDLVNHPELFMGGLSLDLLNAPPLAIQSEAQRGAFENLLHRFDKGGMSISEFKARLAAEVYTETYMSQIPHPRHNPSKYQVANVNHQESLEIRGVRPQESFEYFLLVTELFQSRIRFLKRIHGPIPYERKNFSDLVSHQTIRAKQTYDVQVPAEKIRAALKNYIEQSGLSWKRFGVLMTPELQQRLNSDLIYRSSGDEDTGGVGGRARCESLFGGL